MKGFSRVRGEGLIDIMLSLVDVDKVWRCESSGNFPNRSVICEHSFSILLTMVLPLSDLMTILSFGYLEQL